MARAAGEEEVVVVTMAMATGMVMAAVVAEEEQEVEGEVGAQEATAPPQHGVAPDGSLAPP